MLFIPGDVVRLPSGNTPMTVDYKDVDFSAEVPCVWIDSEGRLQQIILPLVRLEKVNSVDVTGPIPRKGDVVRLAGSEVKMTVLERIPSRIQKWDLCHCCWCDARNEIRHAEFASMVLLVVKQAAV